MPFLHYGNVIDLYAAPSSSSLSIFSHFVPQLRLGVRNVGEISAHLRLTAMQAATFKAWAMVLPEGPSTKRERKEKKKKLVNGLAMQKDSGNKQWKEDKQKRTWMGKRELELSS